MKQQFIHQVTVDIDTYNMLLTAADEAGLGVVDFEARILYDWSRRQRQREHEEHLHDALGVVPGGD